METSFHVGLGRNADCKKKSLKTHRGAEGGWRTTRRAGRLVRPSPASNEDAVTCVWGGEEAVGRNLGSLELLASPLVPGVQKIKIRNLSLNPLRIVEFVKKMVYFDTRYTEHQGPMG